VWDGDAWGPLTKDTITPSSKGEVLVGDGPGLIKLPAGRDTQVLMTDAAQSVGLKYAYVDHGHLINKGKNTHAQIDSFLASKGAPAGIATLDAYGDIPATQLDNINLVPSFVTIHKAVGAIRDSVGKPIGLASLDSGGSVPSHS
jgi:hypothetical protein